MAMFTKTKQKPTSTRLEYLGDIGSVETVDTVCAQYSGLILHAKKREADISRDITNDGVASLQGMPSLQDDCGASRRKSWLDAVMNVQCADIIVNHVPAHSRSSSKLVDDGVGGPCVLRPVITMRRPAQVHIYDDRKGRTEDESSHSRVLR